MTKRPTIRPAPNEDPAPGREYLLESADFMTFISHKRDTAQRAIDDLTSEVDSYRVSIERRNSDTARANGQDEAEIAARLRHISDKEEVLRACDAALSVIGAPPAQLKRDAD